MVDTGITLSAALDSIAEEEDNPKLKDLLLDLKGQVEAGEDLSSALARHPKHFDRTYVSLIRSSEQTGGLGEMLTRIAAYMRKGVETRGKIRASLAYPVIMLILAVGVTIFLLTFVFPKFAPLFERQGTSLPTITKVMHAVSTSMTTQWYFWAGAAVALVGGLLYAKRTEPGRRTLDWIRIHAPLIGGMSRKIIISRSVRTLGTMLRSGVSMLDALKLTADVAGNYYYERLWNEVLDRVTTGDQICDALRGKPLFPKMLVQMISSGEETGKLDEVLEKLSDFYDSEVDNSLKSVTSMIEPILITGMGIVIGTIGMALLLPIFSLSRGAG